MGHSASQGVPTGNAELNNLLFFLLFFDFNLDSLFAFIITANRTDPMR